MIIREQTPPLRVVRGFRNELQALVVHLHNISGGVLGGDKLESRFDVEAGASVVLTTASATRIYCAAQNEGPACISTIVNIGEAALLEYVPDPLIPFAGSRCFQETSISLSSGAGLLWWEIVSPGREARGEVFDYQELAWSLDLRVNGVLTAAEKVHLQPSRTPMRSHIRFGRHRYLAMLYICREGVSPQRWRKLEEHLSELALSLGSDSECFWGISALSAHGIAVRGLTKRGPQAISALKQFLSCAKLELYGRPFVAPRKIY